MDGSINLQVAVWIWVALGAAGVIGAAILAFADVGMDSDEWWATAICLGMGSGGSGLLTLALAMGGWPSIALYVWRGTAIAIAFFGLAIFVQDRSPESRWIAAFGLSLAAVFASLSFQAPSLPKGTGISVSSVAVKTQGQITPSLSTLIWCGTLILLAIGTLIFLVLFAQRLRYGGAPKLETHWEGIGGGLGGWRMSSSLGYLLVACVLALLFTIFLFHFDSRERERELAGTASPTPTVMPSELPTPTVVGRESPTPTVTPTEWPTPTVVPKESSTPTVGPR
jgi:hypothetical protein